MSITGIDNFTRIFPKGRQNLARTAAEFENQMYELGRYLEVDFERLVRHSVLKFFAGNVKRSPVDTGVYRASHGIANGEASETEGVASPKADGSPIPSSVVIAKGQGWQWSVGDGKIILFNNAPYAEVIEFGGYPRPPKRGSWDKKRHDWVIKSSGGFSKQAPQGVYAIGAAEFTKHIQETIESFGSTLYSRGSS